MTQATKKKSKTLWIVVVLIVAVGTGVGLKLHHGRGSGIKYHMSKVQRGEVKATILSTGTVAPENRLDLKAPVAGRVEKVLVEEGQWVKEGQLLAWVSSTERAALIDTARSRGPEELKYWEDSYKMTPILAPKRGLIILKSADSGQTVTQTDIILSMSDRLIVKANVDETDLAQVKQGQQVRLILDAFPGEPQNAKVVHVGYDAKTVSNVTTYEVDVVADKIPAFMKSGMTANVTFMVSEKDDALLVPAAAVHVERGKSIVMVPNPDAPGETLNKEVKLGISDGKKVEIVSGLEEGETIMTAAVRSLTGKPDPGGSSNPLSPQRGIPGGGRPH